MRIELDYATLATWAALILAIVGWGYVYQSGLWDEWPWWGDLLFVLGMMVLFAAPMAIEDLLRWRKLRKSRAD